MKRSHTTGLVLSGGGYRGISHIGVLKAMEELGIKPDYISGTSAGAIVGSLYAAGNSCDQIFDVFTKTELFSYHNYTLKKPGLIDGAKIERLLTSHLKEDSFEHLNIPMYVATTDLIQGKTCFFNSGPIIKPIIASAAVPGVFTPIPLNNMLLCDGGVTNNFPIEPILTPCDTIIGVFLNSLLETSIEALSNTKAVIDRAYRISRVNASEAKFKACDVFIAPSELGKHDVFSKTHAEDIFQMGYEEAKLKLGMLV
ncbi:patatin-like phospholipase family protein [Pseudotamlana agarivorans]|uniref:patatin-like phospholipase family protein n=1 Tax=Pseudotamlana agarivorans TaxID=481183 RepID=UPI0008370207|nr:patatin-like phospholipase family protein [Tamlana agarivorans]